LLFLNADRRTVVLDFLSRLVEWVRVVARTGGDYRLADSERRT
jgi:hypothetical protein